LDLRRKYVFIWTIPNQIWKRLFTHTLGARSMWTVEMALTGSTLVNKNMSCGKYANNSGSDEAARTSGGERGALFLSTNSLRPLDGAAAEVAATWIAPKIRNTYCTRRTVRGFRVYTDILYITYYYSVDHRRRAIKAPETSVARMALPRTTNSIHGNRHETFLPEIQ